MDQATADTLYVNTAGDSMTGPLLVPDIGANTVSAYVAPTAPEHLTRKDYVDSVAGGGGGSGEPETDASGNTTYGTGALPTTTSAKNSAFGENALTAHTTGGEANTALGRRTLITHTTGSYNTAVGGNALAETVEGTGNTAVGYDAGTTNTDEQQNCTFVGYDAKSAFLSPTYGATAVGAMSTADTYAAALGHYAQADGDYSVAIGYQVRASGDRSIGIGASTDEYTHYQIRIGTAQHATDIPGTLTVAGVPVLERLTQLMDIIEALERRITELEAKGHHRFPFGH